VGLIETNPDGEAVIETEGLLEPLWEGLGSEEPEDVGVELPVEDDGARLSGGVEEGKGVDSAFFDS